jgi:regulatory protein spx
VFGKSICTIEERQMMKKPERARVRKAGAAKKPSKSVQFLEKPACETCRKARAFMKRRGYKLRFRDLWKDPLGVTELEKLIGDREHTDFLNKRSGQYRKKKMGEEPPSRREAIRLMAKDPGLIRRQIVVAGGRVVVGFDEEGRARL